MFRKTMLAAATLALVGVASDEAGASSVVLDFEGGPGYAPADNALVGPNTFNAFNIRFVPGETALAFEAVGGEGLTPPFMGGTLSNVQGFVCDTCSPLAYDTARPGAGASLGNFYLRQVAGIGSGLQGAFDTTNAIFSIEYLATPTGIVSGEIWDIDGNRDGSEQWRVEAVHSGGTAVETSPVGSVNTASNPLEAAPWTFTFDADTLTDIERLDFFFTGTKDQSIGVAFDNFRSGVAPIPVPAALPMLIAGVGALGVLRRRRRG